MPGATRQVARQAQQVIEQKLIVAASDMDTAAFAKHFSKRHKSSLAGQEELPENMPFEVEQLYRAFHLRLHSEEPERYRHKHEPERIEYSIDRAIECLIENHNWGWKELAGIEGHVAVFPDGEIATRINGQVKHHRKIEDATDRLVSE